MARPKRRRQNKPKRFKEWIDLLSAIVLLLRRLVLLAIACITLVVVLIFLISSNTPSLKGRCFFIPKRTASRSGRTSGDDRFCRSASCLQRLWRLLPWLGLNGQIGHLREALGHRSPP